MKIVVIGGTGLIGSKLVNNLRALDHEAIAASPASGVNTLTGEGLAEVLAGAQVVVDVSNSPSFEDKAVMEFFQTSGRNLLAAEKKAGVKHHVALSVVGTDRLARQRLLPRQDRAGEADPGIEDAVQHRPLHPVLRVPRRDRAVAEPRGTRCTCRRPSCSRSHRTTWLPRWPTSRWGRP